MVKNVMMGVYVPPLHKDVVESEARKATQANGGKKVSPSQIIQDLIEEKFGSHEEYSDLKEFVSARQTMENLVKKHNS